MANPCHYQDHDRSISLLSLASRDAPSTIVQGYKGISLIRKGTPLGPYRTPMPRVLGGSYGGGRFRMGEVCLYTSIALLSRPCIKHPSVQGPKCIKRIDHRSREEARCIRRGISLRPLSATPSTIVQGYRGASLIRKRTPLGPHGRPMPRVLGWS